MLQSSCHEAKNWPIRFARPNDIRLWECSIWRKTTLDKISCHTTLCLKEKSSKSEVSEFLSVILCGFYQLLRKLTPGEYCIPDLFGHLRNTIYMNWPWPLRYGSSVLQTELSSHLSGSWSLCEFVIYPPGAMGSWPVEGQGWSRVRIPFRPDCFFFFVRL